MKLKRFYVCGNPTRFLKDLLALSFHVMYSFPWDRPFMRLARPSDKKYFPFPVKCDILHYATLYSYNGFVVFFCTVTVKRTVKAYALTKLYSKVQVSMV